MTALLLYGGIAGSRLALLAFGFGLVYLTCGIFHFAHGAAYAAAAYAVGWPWSAWGCRSPLPRRWASPWRRWSAGWSKSGSTRSATAARRRMCCS